VFLKQGKYAVEILKRFQKMDYKPLATPMIPNMKLSTRFRFNLVDPSMYKQLIGSLMYLFSPLDPLLWHEKNYLIL
jgi:hypothetical protein